MSFATSRVIVFLTDEEVIHRFFLGRNSRTPRRNCKTNHFELMPIHNADIAAVFDEIADLLEIDNANPFRVRAYRNAARQIQGMGVAAADMVNKEEDLTELPGIGEDLAAKIVEIVETGKCQALENSESKGRRLSRRCLRFPVLVRSACAFYIKNSTSKRWNNSRAPRATVASASCPASARRSNKRFATR